MAKETRPKKAAAKRKRPQMPQKAPHSAPAPEVAATPDINAMPLQELLQGARARRKGWAEGVTVYVGTSGGRGGQKICLIMTGKRSGELPWRRMSDEDILADDWEVVDPAGGSNE